MAPLTDKQLEHYLDEATRALQKGRTLFGPALVMDLCESALTALARIAELEGGQILNRNAIRLLGERIADLERERDQAQADAVIAACRKYGVEWNAGGRPAFSHDLHRHSYTDALERSLRDLLAFDCGGQQEEEG